MKTPEQNRDEVYAQYIVAAAAAPGGQGPVDQIRVCNSNLCRGQRVTVLKLAVRGPCPKSKAFYKLLCCRVFNLACAAG